MKRWLLLLSMVLMASAQADDELRLRALAANCAACHGTEGRAVEGSLIPGLAGMPAVYFTAQMKAFQNGTRQGTLMPQLAKGYTPAQIAQLAAYFAAQKRAP